MMASAQPGLPGLSHLAKSLSTLSVLSFAKADETKINSKIIVNIVLNLNVFFMTRNTSYSNRMFKPQFCIISTRSHPKYDRSSFGTCLIQKNINS